MIAHRRRYQLPDLVPHPLDDAWSIIVPIARTNLVTNPSFETNTTSYTAVGASIARSTTKQRRGAYSLAVTPSAGTNADGAYYGTVTLAAATTYAYSLDFWGQAGIKYQIYVATTGGVALATKQFTATGFWQRPVLIYTEATGAARRLYVTKVSSNRADVFYVDGVQMEACETGNYFATTYIDGDQLGLIPNQIPSAYVWTNTPHASTSSRSGLTRAGGRIVKFKDFGWFLTAIIGLGLAVPQNYITEYAALDGGQDQGTRKPTRQFTLAGRFAASTYGRLRDNRGGLAALLDRDLSGQDQRLKLVYQAMDGCREISELTEVICKYAGGLEGDSSGHFGSAAPITFTQYLPVVLGGGDAGASLTTQISVSNANRILRRSSGGLWGVMGTGSTGFDGTVNALAFGQGKIIYAGGAFGNADGAPAVRFAQWNDSATIQGWSVVGSGVGAAGGDVLAIALDALGRVYVAGSFTSMDGVANTSRIAMWDPSSSTWSALSTGANGTIYALAFAQDGTLYVAGSFTTIGGVAAAGIARWDGSTFSAMGTGRTGGTGVFAVIVGLDGHLYATGDFTSMGGVGTTAGIAKWNTTTLAWVSIGSLGGTATGYTLENGPDGSIYVGGDFTTAGGVTCNRIARFNGVTFVPLSTGLSAGSVRSLRMTRDGRLYVGGNNIDASVSGVPSPDNLLLWTGATWLPTDIDLPGTPQINAIIIANDGAITIGFAGNGTADAAALTTVTNIGTGNAYPRIVINDVAFINRLYRIVNMTTGRALYFNYQMIGAGDGGTLVLDPDNLSFTSNAGLDLLSTILPGSNEADFFLQPGANVIAVYATHPSNVTMTLSYRPAYLSLDDVP